MKRSSYRDRDYAFGQAVLSLRNAMGLTQAELAEFLGISRYAIGNWESGDKYPKVEHLKQFIALALQYKAFPVGHEAEGIRALWQLAHQKVMLDEHWLASLLPYSKQGPTSETHTLSLTASTPRFDWGDALTVPNFYGREEELRLLMTWAVMERCRVVTVIGFGGIGKSSLVVQLMHQIANHFQVVIWRSLRDVPAYELLLNDCLHALTPQPLEQLPASLEERQNLLLRFMRDTRALLVLDNLESVMEKGKSAGQLRPEYEKLSRVLCLVAETEHQSCVLLTSREKPSDLIPHEGNQTPVRTLRLTQLDGNSCEQLLAEKDVTGSELEKAKLIEAYEGNPLALKIVAQTIVELFNGEIMPFLQQGDVIFGGVRRLLNEQFTRLSRLEQDVLIWLAILREPSSLTDLVSVLIKPPGNAAVLEAILSLSRRSLIEQGQVRGNFTLQSVVLEYMTAWLITKAKEEIEQGRLDRLLEYGLELAHTHEYVRQIETRLIAIPILEHLRNIYSPQPQLEEHLVELLKWISGRDNGSQGYGPANLIVLLRLLRGNLRGLDLSHLLLRDLNLQGVEMQDAHMVNTTIQDSFFTEAFDAMTGVAINRTGEYWAAASRGGEIRVWESGGQILRHVWRGHVDMIWTLTFSPNGLFLASGSNDGSLKLWEAVSGRLLWLGRHKSFVNKLSFSPNGLMLASVGNDANVYLWEVNSGILLQTLPHPNPLHGVTWSPDGHLLASGDIRGNIQLWAVDQVDSPRRLRTLTAHTSCADGLAFAPDGRSLASASWDGTVKLWEVASGQLLQTLTGHTDRVGRVAWSPDGSILASSGVDQIILLWDVGQRNYRGALKGHTSHIYEIAFTPDSRNLLSSSRDGSLRFWDVLSEECVRVIHGYAASIYDVDWSSDGSKLASGGTDLRVTLWDVRTEKPLQVLQEHTSVVCAVGWSSDNRWLASSETEYGIRLWDLNTDANFRFLRHPDTSGNYLYGVAWSPDGRCLASGTHQHGVMIWDILTDEEIWIGRHSSAWFPQVVWSPNGAYLAAGGDDGSVYIWNIVEDLVEQRLSGHHSRITSLAWSPDGAYLASGARGTEEGELFMWDLQRGQRLYSFAGHVSATTAMAWDFGGRQLVSGDGHGTLRWWDVQSGKHLWMREAHSGAIRSLRRSPDSTKLASCGDDGAIMIWDLSSAEHLQTLRRDRPYERLNITGISGLTEAQKGMLYALGATENAHA